jgi:hypothetical protein
LPSGAKLEALGSLHQLMVQGIERMVIVLDDNERMDVVNRIGKAAKSLDLELLLAFFSRFDWYIQDKSGKG